MIGFVQLGDGSLTQLQVTISPTDYAAFQTFVDGYSGPLTVRGITGSANDQPINAFILSKPSWAYRHPFVTAIAGTLIGAAVSGAAGVLIGRFAANIKRYERR